MDLGSDEINAITIVFLKHKPESNAHELSVSLATCVAAICRYDEYTLLNHHTLVVLIN